MRPIIQPDSLYSNSAKPLEGINVGQIYEALNPFGFVGEFQVMAIQASEAVASAGLVLRQEYGVQADESMDEATGGTVKTIVDTSHGIPVTLIDDDNRGYFYYVDDAVVGTTDVGTPEVGEVRNIEDVNTIALYTEAADAVASGDKYQIWKEGRMKLADDDAVIPNWGVSCRALTDEYYGFMVVRGYWMAVTSAFTGTAIVAGGVVCSDGAAGKIQGVTAGTNDNMSIGVSIVDTAEDDLYIPIIVKGFPA